MSSGFQPIGTFPPRRSTALIEARDARTSIGDSIIVPKSRDRVLEFFERDWTPTEAKSAVGGVAYGDLIAWERLAHAMIDTWPHLQKCLREIKLAARKAPWEIQPWKARGQDEPDTSAQKLADEVEDAIWQMRPDPTRNLKGFESMIEALAESYFVGVGVVEPQWEKRDGRWVPVSARVLPARFYNWSTTEDEDMLMLDPSGQGYGHALEEFPEHRFLFAVNSSHNGHPTLGAPLRALSPYWMAVTYGLRWAMVYSQLFGVPFRWATYADDSDKRAVELMMANIGTAGWAAFKQGTELEFLNPPGGSQALPQWKLMEMANEECDIFMLGQTLTSSVGDSGSRALGDIHEIVRKEVIAGVCDFVGEILTHQLVPAYVRWNYGPALRDDMPQIWAKFEEPKDEKSMAERDVALGVVDGSVPVDAAWFYDRHGIPMPEEGAKLLVEEPEEEEDPPENIDPETGEPLEEEEQGDDPTMPKKEVAAANAGDPALTVDELAEATLEGITGLEAKWLAPIKPGFMRLIALAQSDVITDNDFIAALDQFRRELPEAFDTLNADVLREALFAAISSAALAGSTSRYE